MRKFKIVLSAGGTAEVEGQVFTMHIPPYSGGPEVGVQFFYYLSGAEGIVSDKISGGRFATFTPTSTIKGRLLKEARAAVERRLRQYGCETVSKLLAAAHRHPVN